MVEFGRYIFPIDEFLYAEKFYFSETVSWGIRVHLKHSQEILFENYELKDNLIHNWYKLLNSLTK